MPRITSNESAMFEDRGSLLKALVASIEPRSH